MTTVAAMGPMTTGALWVLGVIVVLGAILSWLDYKGVMPADWFYTLAAIPAAIAGAILFFSLITGGKIG